MKKAPVFTKAFPDATTLPAFSDNRPLTWSQILEIHTLALWPESIDEPKIVADLRRSFNKRTDALNHLNAHGLTPIVSSYDYAILKMQGRVI